MESLKKHRGRSARVGTRRTAHSACFDAGYPYGNGSSAARASKRRVVPPTSVTQQVLCMQQDENDGSGSSATLGHAPFFSSASLPPGSLPIRADIRTFDVDKLMAAVGNFQAVICNYPWTDDTHKAGRREDAHDPFSDEDFLELPITTLQQHGYLFLWVPMNKVSLAIEALEEQWGYKVVGNLTWVKPEMLVLHGGKAKSRKNQRAKQTCLVARKGPRADALRCFGDVLTGTDTSGHNKKPDELYKMAEAAAGSGHCLELFASAQGLREGWVSIGEHLPCEK